MMNRGNILLIDDEEKLRHLLKRIIGLEGFTVFEADTLKAGLRILEREPIQVILCDVKLPDGNGIDFIEKVKTRYGLRKYSRRRTVH
jgi:two-component system, NtrC family, response regulator